jgi:hypothetical protein
MKSGENSGNIDKKIRRRRQKSPKTPLPAPHIARAKRAKKKRKNIGRFFAEKKCFSEEVLCFYLPWGHD